VTENLPGVAPDEDVDDDDFQGDQPEELPIEDEGDATEHPDLDFQDSDDDDFPTGDDDE
jgi:hypothetical protein